VISALEAALASIHDAAAVKTPPWMALVAGLAAVRPTSIDAAIEWLVTHRGELEESYAAGASARLGPAMLPPELQRSPELGFTDRPRDDNKLREKYLNADIVGRWSFTQATVYAITGREISRRDGELLDEFGSVNLLVDARVWAMAVTRRAGGTGATHAEAALGGMALLGSHMLAGAAAGNCARFLLRAQAAAVEGRSMIDLVGDVLARRERVMGFGRPVVGPDERVPVIDRMLAKYGRGELPFVRLLRDVEAAFRHHRGLGTTAAAWAAAILLDFELTPVQVEALSNHWVSVCVSAQAAFSIETRV
jgi:hypothetical protein